MNAQYRVILADDHLVVRSGLRRLLEQNGEIQVVGEAEDGEHAYQKYNALLPDVMIMDLSMPGMGGLEAARRIIKRHPAARILIFSMHENASFAMQSLKAGVKGYVTKNGMAEDLCKAVLEIARGKTFLSPDIAQKIALHTLTGEDDPVKQLSAREFEVFRLLATGAGTEEISDMLKISQKTVANYHTMIKQKLGVSNPIELVRYAMKHGLVEHQQL